MASAPFPIQSANASGLQVIGLGLGRTGTGSLKVARMYPSSCLAMYCMFNACDVVNQLGYKTFHMSELPKDLDRLHAAWTGIYTSESMLRYRMHGKAAWLTTCKYFQR